MNDLLNKIPVRTVTTIVIILIGMTLSAIAVMEYQIFMQKDGQGSAPLFSEATPLPTITPSLTPDLPPASLTPDVGLATVTPTPNPMNEFGEETAAPSIGVHPTFVSTNQPCENCHQDLHGGG